MKKINQTPHPSIKLISSIKDLITEGRKKPTIRSFASLNKMTKHLASSKTLD